VSEEVGEALSPLLCGHVKKKKKKEEVGEVIITILKIHLSINYQNTIKVIKSIIYYN
jgi:hypothetical protein